MNGGTRNNQTAVAFAIAALTREHFDRTAAGGSQGRVVVPGLTERIAVALHERLADVEGRTYLVIPRHSAYVPSADHRWLYSEALTSVRQGAMIVVVFPGEMSAIHESVIGTGGAVRSVAFSDEWPWVDKASSHFSFVTRFLPLLLDEWGVSGSERDVVSSLLIRLVRDTAREVDRAEILLDQIIGNFEVEREGSELSIAEQFLRHVGVPRPRNLPRILTGLVEPPWAALGKLLEQVAGRCTQANAREEILERSTKVDPELAPIVENFLDSLLSSSTGEATGLLAISKGLRSEIWCSLGEEELRRIFEIVEHQETVQVGVQITSGRLVNAKKSQAVLFEGESIDVEVHYDGIPRDNADEYLVELFYRTRVLHRFQCHEESGSAIGSLNLPMLFPRSRPKPSKVPLRAELKRGEDVVATVQFAIFPCCEEAPLLLVMNPGFEIRYGAQSEDDETTAAVAGEIELAVACAFGEAPVLQVDNEAIELDGEEGNKVYRAKSTVDARENPAGRSLVSATVSDYRVDVALEAQYTERGEFTLEREFVYQVADGTDARVRRLERIFSGTIVEPYSYLSIPEHSAARGELAKRWEDPEFGGRPFLVDFDKVRTSSLQDREMISGLGCSTDRFQGAELGPVGPLIVSYEAARKRLINLIASRTNSDGRWPIYAYYPIYVERAASEHERAIEAYLEAYTNILKALPDLRRTVSWEALFLVLYRDIAVHWQDGASNDIRLALAGPWHPLVVAKRFMVQSALLQAARRRLSRSSGPRFQALARLFDQVSGFHWLPALDHLDRSFGAVYAASTTDPGWHVLVGPTILNETEHETARSLVGEWGLDTTLLAGSLEVMARNYLGGFSAAYPGHRSITVRATSVYSPAALVKSAQQALYAEAGGSTALGARLSGGVHLYTDRREQDLQLESRLRWRKPPLCIYAKSEGSRDDTQHDILLLPPAQARVSGHDDRGVGLPRGESLEAVFSAPLRAVSTGARGTPMSAVLEWEEEPRISAGIGGKFRMALLSASSFLGGPRAVYWDFHLPSQLNCTWNIIPGGQVDPAALVSYVDAGGVASQVRSLWEYRMSITGSQQSYFVVTLVPPIVKQALNGSPVLEGESIAETMLHELGRLGISIGSESVRTAKGAVGSLGVVAAVRLLNGIRSGIPRELRESTRQILLPVDSFHDIFADPDHGGDRSQKRGDLILIRLHRREDHGRTVVSPVLVECKYLTSQMSGEYASKAAAQAKATFDKLYALMLAARSPSGLAERLALTELISFGLRLSSAGQSGINALDRRLLGDIIRGDFEIKAAGADVLVISTEIQLTAASIRELSPRGLWIRTGPGHWPGVSESPELTAVRERLGRLFLVAGSGGLASPARPVDVQTEKGPDSATEAAPLVDEKEQSEAHASPTAQVAVEGVQFRALIGCAESGRAVFLEPEAYGRRLENRHVMVTGSSGKGKTQLIKSLVWQARQAGVRVILLDFKNDFADDQHFLRVSDVSPRIIRFDGLPYNPLIPVPVVHPHTGQRVIQCAQHISGIRDILEKTFRIGDQQAGHLKDTILDSYRQHGIDPFKDVEFREDYSYPDFNEIGHHLRERSQTAYRRLDRLFELGIFREDSRARGFEALINESLVLDLSQLPADAVKNAIARIVILSAHAYYNALPHAAGLRQLMVFDEAHRVLASPDLEKLAREARAYGVGIVLSSQNPTDFPNAIAAQMLSKIIHGTDMDRDRVRGVQGLLGDQVTSDTVMRLGMFEALLSNIQYPCEKVRTLGYPHLLLYSFLRERGPTPAAELTQVDGVDPAKLPIDKLLEHLMQMGLVRHDDGTFNAVGV